MARKAYRRLGKAVRWLLVICVIGVAGGFFAWRRIASAQDSEDNTMLTVAVRKGPLVISVTEAGTIKPREQTVIKSQVEGRSTILYLIEEGRRVDEGELLVELDATNLVDERVDQEIRVQNAEAQYIQARENLEVVKNQAKSDLDKAELNVRFAKEDLKKYQDGEYPNERKKLESKITLAEEELERAKQKLDWSRQLYKEKYLSQTELQADELAFNKASLDLELAKNNLALLEDYTYTRNIEQLTSDLNQAEMALERVRRRTAADVVQAEAQLQARQSEYERQKQKLEKTDEQIEKAKIYAPTDGTVVYATSTQFSWRGNVEPLDEGLEVRERQELIHLPVADTFMAVVKVHESSLKKIYVGLPVQLTVDALPGNVFKGKVSKIAPLPDPQSMFMNPDLKLYTTEIEIDGGAGILRTGMTCEAEILVARYDDAMYVPVQCVVRENGQPTVYVANGEEAQPRPVEIGLDNNTMVHIKSGLEIGEEVLLTPPLSGAASSGDASRPDVGDVVIPERPRRDSNRGRTNASGEEAKSDTGGAEDRKKRDDAKAADPDDAGDEDTQAAGDEPNADDAQPEESRERRGRQNMSPEERQQMRERFQKMSPEEREAFRKRMQERGQRQDNAE